MKKIILSICMFAAVQFHIERCFGKECIVNFKVGGADHMVHFYQPAILIDTLFDPGSAINLAVDISIVPLGSCICVQDSVWWSINGNIIHNSLSYTVTDTGVYTIYENISGVQYCDDSTYSYQLTLHVGHRSTISVSEISNANSIHIYPTISNGIFKLNTDATCHISKIAVGDEAGRIVYSSKTEFSEINLSRFSQGIYFYSVEDETGKVYRGKLIKD